MGQFETFIPFGKYKGQPLNVMLNDESYLRWYFDENLSSSYPDFHTILMSALQGNYLDNDINQGNILQADFLNPLFCVEFTKSILETDVDYNLTGELFEVHNLQFENEGYSVSFNYKEMDSKKVTLLDLPIRIWVFGYIDDNYRPILAKLNEIIQKSNPALNVLYVKEFRAKSINHNTFAFLLYNQKIFLKFQFKMQNEIEPPLTYKNTNDDEVPF